MNVREFEECPDGSAIMTVDLSPTETSVLVEYALQQLMKKAVEEYDARSSEPS